MALSGKKLEALRELARRKQIRDWQESPLLWMEERLGESTDSFDWNKHEGYADHEWDGTVNPISTVWKVLGNSVKEVANGDLPTYKNVSLESGTGTGKTYWLARLVFWFLDCFPNSLVVTSAPSETQLKLGLWSEISMLYPKIKELRPHSEKWKLRLAMETSMGDDSMTAAQKAKMQTESWHAVAFTTGVKADEESANKARGFHRKYMLIILEECTGIPLSILTAFINTCTGNTNFIVAVGNPDNEFDTLHQFSLQKDCFAARASSLDHPNIVLQKEIYAGSVTQSSINSRTDKYGDTSPMWQAMVRGISPTQAADSLIKLDWITQCINTEHEDAQGSHNAVGVDVANSKRGDKAAIAWGQRNNLVEVEEFYCENATDLAHNLYMDSTDLGLAGFMDYNTKRVADYDTNPDCIGVDAVGVGVATVNGLSSVGYNPQSLQGGSWKEVIPTEERWEAGVKKEVPLYTFPNLRAQMYWQLREDLRLKQINIIIPDKKNREEIVKEMCIPKMVITNTRIEVEGKETIKKRMGGKSPNRMDGIVYWNWVRRGYRINNFGWAAISGG